MQRGVLLLIVHTVVHDATGSSAWCVLTLQMIDRSKHNQVQYCSMPVHASGMLQYIVVACWHATKSRTSTVMSEPCGIVFTSLTLAWQEHVIRIDHIFFVFLILRHHHCHLIARLVWDWFRLMFHFVCKVVCINLVVPI